VIFSLWAVGLPRYVKSESKSMSIFLGKMLMGRVPLSAIRSRTQPPTAGIDAYGPVHTSNIVEATFDFVEATLTQLCCHKRQQCRSTIRHCRKNRSTCSVRQCCFDVVASMDEASVSDDFNSGKLIELASSINERWAGVTHQVGALLLRGRGLGVTDNDK